MALCANQGLTPGHPRPDCYSFLLFILSAPVKLLQIEDDSMNIFNKLRAARLDGKAIKCFNIGMHNKVIEYLERASEIDQERSRNEVRNYYLGLSYIKLGISRKASESLSLAYRGFSERAKKDNRFLNKFMHLSKVYVDFLLANGKEKLARNIIEQTDKLLIDKGYELDLRKKQTKIIIE